MQVVRKVSMAALGLVAWVAVGGAAVLIKQERVPGGTLEATWLPGFGVGRLFTPLTLTTTDPANPNPSGDNTVAVLQNNDISLGGIAECATDPSGYADYVWEADFFTGGGNTRRGIVLRADPTNGFQSFYQLVINSGLFLVRFRKFVAGNPLPDLASWTTDTLPNGIPQLNTWHNLCVIAAGNTFHCFLDRHELTPTTGLVDADAPLLTGWVGAYNFSASVGEVPVYFDNLKLSTDKPTPTHSTTWGELKKLYR